MEPFQKVKSEQDGQPVLFYIEGWMNDFPNLTAGFTSRHGGVSKKPFESFNCGLHVNDLSEHVVTNRQRLAEALEMPFDAFTYAEQVHGNEIAVIKREDQGKGRASRAEAIQSRDGFVTNEKELVLCALFADCVPLFFYDPVLEAAGLAHAGWKGTVLDVAGATIKAMNEQFGSKPEHIRAAIGPSIGICCYEVDEKVAVPVKRVLTDMNASPETLKKVLQPKENQKYMLNLQELNRKFIEKAGILSSSIEVTELCTSCRTDVFFSHRQENGATGRMAAWITIRQNLQNKQDES
jgi:YfiH family protein